MLDRFPLSFQISAPGLPARRLVLVFPADRGRLAGAAAIAAAALITYRSSRARAVLVQDKAVLIGCAGLVAVLLFCLIRPTLILKPRPATEFPRVLIDDSRSMLIADRDGQPRSQFVQRECPHQQPAAQGAAAALRPPVLQIFSSAGRLGSPAELKYDGTSTKLGDALERAGTSCPGCRSPAS